MAPPTTTDTRERILGAAADLFAHKGYSGTRTREISDAVGIRQPSLFHHFASKAEIAEALLEHSLAGVVAPIRALAERDQPASTRLYGYVYSDTIFLATSPYDMRGLQVGDIIDDPLFARWSDQLAELRDCVTEIVRQGVERGEFIRVDPLFARQAITGLHQMTITTHHGEGPAQATQRADDIASFALRALLTETAELARVRREGSQIAERLSAEIAEGRQNLRPATYGSS